MSELKFEEIKVGDKFEDIDEDEWGVVVEVAPEYIRINWGTSGDLSYFEDEFHILQKYDTYIPVHSAVTSPPHYKLPNGTELIDIIRDETFTRGSLIKYVVRAPHKGNELQDLLKARQFLNWEIERVEKESK